MIVEYLTRTIERELTDLVSESEVVLIEGAKAVGKTSTAARLCETAFRLTRTDQRNLVANDPSVIFTASPPVLLDEWQRVPETWDVIRDAVDEGLAGSIVLTGSANPWSAATNASSLHSGAGRILTLRMRPLSLAERASCPSPTISLSDLVLGDRPPLTGKGSLTISDYAEEILRSGFPAIAVRSDSSRTKHLSAYSRMAVDREMPELGRAVRNPTAVMRWLRAYAAATATTTSFEKIRDAANSGQANRQARSTSIPYRDALERIFLLDPLPGWQPGESSIARVGSGPKHHLVDPALAANLLGATRASLVSGESPVAAGGNLFGRLFESLATLCVRVYAEATGASIGHFRTHRGEREIDLIIERPDGRVLAIEVKLGRDAQDEDVKHLQWLESKLGDRLLDSVVITSGAHAYRRKDGVGIIPLELLGP